MATIATGRMDHFTAAYIECALGTSTDGDDDRPLGRIYGVDDIHPSALAEMLADCAAFQSDHRESIASDLARAGHDFWLTRNRHGTGFWDGDWEYQTGKRLTDDAHAWGESCLYIGDDGFIYVA